MPSSERGCAPLQQRVILSWSGGKDSALCLQAIAEVHTHEVATLLTTVSEAYERSSMHGVRTVLLEEQAESLGLSLEKVYLSADSSNDEYEQRMRKVLEKWQAAGVGSVVFGDIFLEDLRKYRENNLARLGMQGLFPLWKRSTPDLAIEFLRLGYKAVVTCVDSQRLDRRFVGRDFDEGFLSDLPAGVDLCGENGEFHSFVWDGPLFRRPLSFERGEVVLRDNRFYFCDLVPVR